MDVKWRCGVEASGGRAVRVPVYVRRRPVGVDAEADADAVGTLVRTECSFARATPGSWLPRARARAHCNTNTL